jgi:prepilin-type N-terminal cleavage/methylation domain-containing protein
MLEKLRAARGHEDGFTLIELLIVVVILGVLAAVAVFGVQAFNNEGKAAACDTDWKSVETANEALYAKTGAYAADTLELKNKFFLKEEPSTTNGYTISIVGGVVKAAGACTH